MKKEKDRWTPAATQQMNVVVLESWLIELSLVWDQYPGPTLV